MGHGIARELALQWAKHGVRVNALVPAYFETELTAQMFADEKSLDWIQKQPRHPLSQQATETPTFE